MVIIYQSDSGFTKLYAEMFARKVGIECHSLYMSRIKVRRNSDVIYFGRVINGEIDGLKKVRKKHHLVAVCPVGLKMPVTAVKEEIIEKNRLEELASQVFYLRGGFKPQELAGLEKTLVNLIIGDLESKGEDIDAVDAQFLSDLKGGADYVKEINLEPVGIWYENA